MNKNYYIAPSEIHGDGLFASVDFKKGGMVGLAHVNNQPVTEIGKFHNHDEKNPTMISKKIGNKRYVYANQDLKAGAELTTNYRMQPELGQPEEFDVPKAQDGIFLSSGKFRPQTNTIGSTLGYKKVFPKRDTTWSLTGNVGYAHNYEADKSGLAASINAENFGKFFGGQRRVNAVTNLEAYMEPGNYGAQVSAGPNLHWGTHPKRSLPRGRGRLDFQPFNLRLGYQSTPWKDTTGAAVLDAKNKMNWGYGAKLKGEYKPKLKGKFRPTLFGDVGVDADFLKQEYNQDKVDAGSIYGDSEGFKIQPSFSANIGIRVPIDGSKLRRRRRPDPEEDDVYYNPGIRTSDPNSVEAYEEPDDYQEGGFILDLNEQEAQRYAEGGYILEELAGGGEDCPDGYVLNLNGDCVLPDYTGSEDENVNIKDELEAQGYKDETSLLKDAPKGLSMFSLKPGQSVEDLLGSLKQHPFAKTEKDKEFIKKNKKDWADFVDEFTEYLSTVDKDWGEMERTLDRNKPDWDWLQRHEYGLRGNQRNVLDLVDIEDYVDDNGNILDLDDVEINKRMNIGYPSLYKKPINKYESNRSDNNLTKAGEIIKKHFGSLTMNSDGWADAYDKKENELKEYFAKKLGKKKYDIDSGSKLLNATLYDTEKSGKYKPLYTDLQKEYDKMPFNIQEEPVVDELQTEEPPILPIDAQEEAIAEVKEDLPIIPLPITEEEVIEQPLPSPEEFYADSLPVTNSEGEIVLPYEETTGKYKKERRGTRRPGTKGRAWDGVRGNLQRIFTDKEYSGSWFPGLKRKIKQEGGPIVKQRKGVRENYDHSVWTPSGEFSKPSSVSSHLMAAEEVPGRGWVGFPTLFQGNPYVENESMLSTNVGEWLDMSDQNNGWWPIYEEADRRGEVYDFGEDKEAALAFGEGSWKDQLPDEGMEIELTDEEVEQYKAGGYVLEELEEGGEDDELITYKRNKKLIDAVGDWQTESDVKISSDYNDQIKARLLTGNFGYNPKTGELVKLGISERTLVKDKEARETRRALKALKEMQHKDKIASFKDLYGQEDFQREDFTGNFLSPYAVGHPVLFGKGGPDDKIAKDFRGGLSDLYRYYGGLPLQNNILQYSKTAPTDSKDKNAKYISLNKDQVFLDEVWRNYLRVNSGNLSTTSQGDKEKKVKDGVWRVSGYSSGGRGHHRTKKQGNAHHSNAIGRYKISEGEDDKGHFIQYYDQFDQGTGSGGMGIYDFIEDVTNVRKPFEIYDRIYYNPRTMKRTYKEDFKDGGYINVQLTDEEAHKYRTGGYILEEIK